MDEKIAQLKQFFPDIRQNIPMSEHTTLSIGGPAAYFIEVTDHKDLIQVVTEAIKLDIPFMIISGGSNLLVSDDGIDRLVIKDLTTGIELDGDITKVKSGTILQELVDWTIHHQMAGIHKMTGIPGRVGGAIYGNAGAYGQTISDHLIKVIAYDPTSQQKIELSKEECGFSYRDSNFKNNELVILEGHFLFPKGDTTSLQAESDECMKLRIAKYKPGIKCPGSFFKNLLSENIPTDVLGQIEYKDTFGKIPAWVFLNEVGARGASKGDIHIASHHSNLISNEGHGTAKDFWELASEYAHKVKDKFGITLEPEVQLVNLPPLI
jgi:UDP-N-acetylmuramate dehydrogenase